MKGFSRAQYPDPENDDFGKVVNLAGNETGWLPAIEHVVKVYLLKLNKEEINKWLQSFDSKGFQ